MRGITEKSRMSSGLNCFVPNEIELKLWLLTSVCTSFMNIFMIRLCTISWSSDHITVSEALLVLSLVFLYYVDTF